VATAAPDLELDAQYRAMREEAGLLDRSGRGKLIVSGAEARDYLQGQLTNEIETLEPNRGCYAALLDRKGHIQGDLRLLQLSSGDLWIDTEPAAVEPVLRHLDTYKIGREVEVRNASEDWAIISLIGPAAGEVAGIPVPSPEHAQRYFERNGIEVLAVASDLGLDLITRSEQRGRLQELLVSAGAVEISEEAAEILRVESGRPRFGVEMGPETMPAEAGIVERAVDFEKGCYIGQEPVARLHYRGKPNRRLCGLRLSAPVEAGAPLLLGDRAVGVVGTAVVSPRFGPIALAVVRREAESGAELQVGDGGATATVAPSASFG
jgi:folate-binding protein YgfZ